jgi:predicted DNA-binding transcriptional regulator YafY
MMQLEALSKNQIERLRYIEFRAMFLGEVKRSDIMLCFGIAPAAATRDISLYREISNNNIALEQKSKTYLPSDTFQPIFEHAVNQVLNALSNGYGLAATAAKPFVLTDFPRVLSSPKLDILAVISQAIYQNKIVRMTYHSFSSGKTTRDIAPFALINNGHRWHVRAYNRKNSDFRDFVLTRIEAVSLINDSYALEHERAAADAYWSRIVELELVPHPKRTDRDQNIINMDYEMKDGVLKVPVRAALVGYLLRQWSVDCSADQSLIDEEYRLWLRNYPILYGIDNAKLAPGYAATHY